MMRAAIAALTVGLVMIGSGNIPAAIILDADTVQTGSQLDTSPLTVKPWGVWGPDGTVFFTGTIASNWTDSDFYDAGARDNAFNVSQSSGQNEARLTFDFEVDRIQFVFGGGGTVGSAEIEFVALDSLGNEIAGTKSTQPTWLPHWAGPVTINAGSIPIYGLKWLDLPSGGRTALLDNITLTPVPLSGVPVPEPSMLVFLSTAGAALVFLSRRRFHRAA